MGSDHLTIYVGIQNTKRWVTATALRPKSILDGNVPAMHVQPIADSTARRQA